MAKLKLLKGQMPGHAEPDLPVRPLAPRRLMTRGRTESESEPQSGAEYA